MRLKLKLFAGLANYLPDEVNNNLTILEITGQSTINSIIDEVKVPREKAHLILLNGIYISPEERDTANFVDGDTLAIWPPVAGG